MEQLVVIITEYLQSQYLILFKARKVVCEHLASINVPAVATENILNTLVN